MISTLAPSVLPPMVLRQCPVARRPAARRRRVIPRGAQASPRLLRRRSALSGSMSAPAPARLPARPCSTRVSTADVEVDQTTIS
ncbi:hypothetical protein BV20DRAFT_742227 [Pilatotrama ljubarskyi]|nr:hypothetical protein BV20DRAFT_742227 [Pilatotrama ljubarskyi]